MPETPTLLCVLCGRDEDHHTALKQCYVRHRGVLVPSPNERYTPAIEDITSLRSALASSRADTERLWPIVKAARRYAATLRSGSVLNEESRDLRQRADALAKALRENQQCGWCYHWLPEHAADCRGVANHAFADSPEGIARADAALAAGLKRGEALLTRTDSDSTSVVPAVDTSRSYPQDVATKAVTSAVPSSDERTNG